MQIRQIVIKRFRGIKLLNWLVPPQKIVCLIGKGDSTKSTILEAIEYALSSRWSIPINDADFYLCKTDDPIEIYVTVGNLPDHMLSERVFGLKLRGWKNNQIHNEPDDDCEPVVTIKLQINSNLEPEWSLYRDNDTDERRVSSKKREMLGAISVRNYADRDLSWSRGSSLSRLTDDAVGAITEAHREARRSLKNTSIQSLETAAEKTQQIASSYGVAPQHDKFQPALDTGITTGLNAFTLHDGDIPLRMLGLGSKRLVSIGIQEESIPDGAILLLDEVEQGLEPFRLRNLIQKLKNNSKQGQVFMTTHSSVSVDELAGKELNVVQILKGVTTVKQIPDDFRVTIQNAPETLLAAKVLVCEGATEYGICTALDAQWKSENSGIGFGYLGVVPVVYQMGGGTGSSIKLATTLAELGYNVSLFMDSDVPIRNEKDLKTKVTVIRWDGKVNLEQRVFLDMPWSSIQELLDYAILHKGKNSILTTINSSLGLDTTTPFIDTNINKWLSVKSEKDIREALGSVASKKSWFKERQKGEDLGRFIIKNFSDVESKDLGLKIIQLKAWAYDNNP